MPSRHTLRTSRGSSTPTLPEELSAGTALIAAFHENGLLDAVEQSLPLSRRNGHGARGLFVFAVVFLLAGVHHRIRPFATRRRDALQRLVAPIAGLAALPSPAAVSRALGDLTHEEARAFLARLLLADASTDALLHNPLAQHRDALGGAWHVVDFDPTIEAFRQRSLSDDPGLPVAVRRAVGTRGYTGHKRGDVRVRHLPLIHAGAALWLGYRLTEESGLIFGHLRDLVAAARGRLRGPLVVRGDGEFGSVGAMRSIQGAGADFVTRNRRYDLLDRESAKTALASSTWWPVPSSGSGPVRAAAELGTFEFHPHPNAEEAERGPVSARIVVTRFARTSVPDHGVLHDGFQYELFATSLPADAWPADALVALYFGRASLENRFAQEDREFGVDRTFSFHPAGQEWMSGIALFLWNVLVCSGAADARWPQTPPQELRAVVEPPKVGENGPPTPTLEEDTPTPTAAPCVLAAPAPASPRGAPVDESEGAAPHASRRPPTAPTVTAASGVPLVSVPPGPPDPEVELWAITRVAFRDLVEKPGWRLDDDQRAVLCPNDKPLLVHTAAPRSAGRPKGDDRIFLRGAFAACDGCPLRVGCATHRLGAAKHITRVVPNDTAARADELLRQLRGKPHPRHEALPRRIAAPLPELQPTPNSAAPGPFRVYTPTFLPSEARKRARDLIEGVSLEVTIGRRPRPGRAAIARAASPLVAGGDAQRRHDRESWNKRRTRWACTPLVTIHIIGSTAKRTQKLISSMKMLLLPM